MNDVLSARKDYIHLLVTAASWALDDRRSSKVRCSKYYYHALAIEMAAAAAA